MNDNELKCFLCDKPVSFDEHTGVKYRDEFVLVAKYRGKMIRAKCCPACCLSFDSQAGFEKHVRDKFLPLYEAGEVRVGSPKSVMIER